MPSQYHIDKDLIPTLSLRELIEAYVFKDVKYQYRDALREKFNNEPDLRAFLDSYKSQLKPPLTDNELAWKMLESGWPMVEGFKRKTPEEVRGFIVNMAKGLDYKITEKQVAFWESCKYWFDKWQST